ncbi:SH3 domain-containing protein [Corticibacterium sp. UT-5YL-CI-8]|nr:SH3 domain-containing protein [Tianweitania sp. UT-5YL-CI-8]
MKKPFGPAVSKNARGLVLTARKTTADWRCDAPARRLVLATVAMTVVLAVTAVSALFILPRSGQWSAQVIDPAAAAEANDSTGRIAEEVAYVPEAQPVQRQGRVSPDDLTVQAVEPLTKADPRWSEKQPAKNKPIQPPSIVRQEADPAALPTMAASLLPTESLRNRVVPDIQPQATDPGATAAIETKAAPAAVPAKADTAKNKPVEQGAVDGKSATIKSSVNMRASPQKGAKVLGVVPRNAKVALGACTAWCEIEFNGQKGFVYKSYIR